MTSLWHAYCRLVLLCSSILSPLMYFHTPPTSFLPHFSLVTSHISSPALSKVSTSVYTLTGASPKLPSLLMRSPPSVSSFVLLFDFPLLSQHLLFLPSCPLSYSPTPSLHHTLSDAACFAQFYVCWVTALAPGFFCYHHFEPPLE